MFRSLAVAALVISFAAALPQGINFAAFDAAPTPAALGPPLNGRDQVPTYNPSVAAQSAAAAVATNPVKPDQKRSLRPRTACQLQPKGYGPVSDPDEYATFMSDTQYDDIALSAKTPDGYSLSFSGLQGATEGPGYMGYYTMKSYDTIKCQQYCDAVSSCQGFNVFIERDPKYEPADSCPTSPSISNYKCSLWGLPVSGSSATNKGQWRNQFLVGIRGSNAADGWAGPSGMGGAIVAPSGYMGMRFFSGPYNPGMCASVCQETTAYDRDHLVRVDGTYDACNFFNSYVLSKNGQPQGTYCTFYTRSWDRSYATNTGEHRGDDYYSVSQSYTYTLDTQDPGHV